MISKKIILLLLLSTLCIASLKGDQELKLNVPKLVIAHHMNAGLPAKAGGQDALAYGSNTPLYRKEWSSIGGRIRDMSITNLYDFPHTKTKSEQVAWEIQVALRSGIDAFAFYGTLPHSKAHLLEYMKAAKGTGFKITLCQSGGERGSHYEKACEALKSLVELDKKMNTLLRIDGKLLLLTYGGNWGNTVEEMIAKRKDLEARVGTPMLVMYAPFSITSAGHIRNNPKKIAELYKAERKKITALFQGGFDGLSPFVFVTGDRVEEDCRFWKNLCKEYGKLYYQPVSMQFHSPKHMTHAPIGDSIWKKSWELAKNGSDGVQLVTWNDWGESTAMAPGINVNYGLYDLLKHSAQHFKFDQEKSHEEKAWVMYYRYPSGMSPKLFPPTIKEHGSDAIRKFRTVDHDFIWVKTVLNEPAVIHCEGRGQKRVAAGEVLTSFPLTAGPVKVTLTRNGKVIKTLSPPEVITNIPWRVDHSLIMYGSDLSEHEYRRQDFPGQKPRFYSEYDDDDSDGLFNWFEGLFFSVLESPVTSVNAKSLFNGMRLKDYQEKMLSPLKSEYLDLPNKDILMDLTDTNVPFACAIWRNRYHWNKTSVSYSEDGLYIMNPTGRETRESYFFYDSVPNSTYGPNCFYGDLMVSANVNFNFGDKEVNEWGRPEFSLLSRVSKYREAMIYGKLSILKKHKAKLTIGWKRLERWKKIEGDILKRLTFPINNDGAFKLELSVVNLSDEKVQIKVSCGQKGVLNPIVINAEHLVKDSGIQRKGEIGFSTTLADFKNTKNSPNRIELKSLELKHIKLDK